MEKSEIAENIKKILTKVLKQNYVDMENEDVKEVKGWDSLSHIIIISEIEEYFNIKLTLRDLNKIKNVFSLVEVVQSKLYVAVTNQTVKN